MNKDRKVWLGILIGGMSGVCGGIQLAAQNRDPKAAVYFAFFAVSFAFLGGITGAIFQAAIARREPVHDQTRSGDVRS